MERWKGKVALVTGASSGIGAAIAISLVEAGVIVVGLARRKEKIEAIAKGLEGKAGTLYAVKADITKEDDILEAFKWIKSNLGPIHILINNAGVIKNTNLIDGVTELWKETIDTNVIGLCIVTREAMGNMRANNVDGHIIHINSGAGHKVPNIPGANVYPATKFAVTVLAETLRQELIFLESKIKISSVSPGAVKTNFGKELGNLEDLGKTIPMLKAVDVANAVMYVLGTPPEVEVQELLIKATGENF